MSVLVRIPTAIRTLTAGAEEVTLETPTNVAAAIEELERKHPGMRDRVLDEKGAVRKFIIVYVGDEDIRFLDGLATGLKDGDQVSLVPAIAGGA